MDLWQVRMGDPADIGLVNAHAKSDRRHDDQPVLRLEALLHLAACRRLHAPVIVRRRQMAGLTEARGTGVSVLARVPQ